MRDIAERPAPVDHLPWLLLACGGVLVLAVLAFLLVPSWLRARRQPMAPAPADPSVAAIEALRELRELPDAAVAARVQDILRRYLHRRHGALGLYRTANELIGARGPQAPPPSPAIAPFAEVLSAAEALRYSAGPDTNTGLVVMAIAAVESDSAQPPTNPSAIEPCLPH